MGLPQISWLEQVDTSCEEILEIRRGLQLVRKIPKDWRRGFGGAKHLPAFVHCDWLIFLIHYHFNAVLTKLSELLMFALEVLHEEDKPLCLGILAKGKCIGACKISETIYSSFCGCGEYRHAVVFCASHILKTSCWLLRSHASNTVE